MRRKVIVRTLTAAMSAAMLAYMLPAGAFAAEAVPEKTETVYIITDASGEPTEIISSNHITNPDGEDTISDSSSLSDIQVVKGDAEMSGSGDNISWSTGGDVYYQGNATEDLPVGTEITYELDGKEVSPEDLAGQSGHLVMTIHYTNNESRQVSVGGSTKTMYVPFIMATAMMVDSDVCSNISVDHGLAKDDGDKTVIIGYGMPGLAESLDLTGTDAEDTFNDTVTVEMDVTDFNMQMAGTVASSSFMNDVDFDDVTELDELESSLNELSDAASQLVDGAAELAEGANTLSDGAARLESGSAQLDDGASTLASGVYALADGGASLASGASQVADGAGQLSAGTQKLATGASALTSGIDTAYDGSDTLADGLETISSSITAIPGGFRSAAAAASTISGNLTALANGTAKLSASAGTLSSGITNYSTQIYNGANTLVAGMESAGNVLTQTMGANNQVIGTLRQLKEAAVEAGDTSTAEVYQSMIETLTTSVTYQAAVQATLTTDPTDGTTSLHSGAAALAVAADPNGTTAQQLSGGASTIAQTLGGTTDANTISGSLTALANGSTELSSQMTTAAGQADLLVKGAASAYDGADALRTGLGEALSGSTQLSDGLSAALPGAEALSTGASQVASGASQLNSGIGQVSSGADTLSSGATTLHSGASTLASGASTLAAGADKLSEGMTEFNSDGIEKLVSVYEDNIPALVDRLEALKDLGQDYNSYSGIADGMDGEVSFIFRMDAIGEDE